MKIAIRAEGGPEIGLGHLVRCGALARAFGKQGHEARFFSRAASGPWLEAQGFAHTPLPACAGLAAETGAFIRAAQDWGADAALIDSYEPTAGCYHRMLEWAPTIVLDDYLRLPYAATCLVNGNVYAPGLDYSPCTVEKLLLGGQYVILREEFLNLPPKELREQGRRVLVTMGGADLRNYTPVVLEALEELAEITIQVVVGPAFQNLAAIRQGAGRCAGRVEIFQQPADLPALISACDLAVAAAGSTVYELCVLGTPAVLIGQAANQNLICDFFKNNGAMLYLGDYRQVTAREIKDAGQTLLKDMERRRRMREKQLQLVGKRGATRIVEETIKQIEKRS